MITQTETRWQIVLPLRAVDLQLPELPKTLRVEPADKSAQARNQTDAAFDDGSLARAPFDPDAPTGPPPAFEANVLDARHESWSRSNFDLTIGTPSEQGAADPTFDLRR